LEEKENMQIDECARGACPVVWFEVMGQDADKLRDFYGELLGWRFRTTPPRAYSELDRAEGSPGISGGIGQTGPGHPNWMTFYTRVPDLDAAIERARGLGSQVLMPPVRLADTTVAVVSDPEGHPVGLCTAHP
jgi:predicted enzyme related to lactoylglutathione lyase